MPKTSKRLAHYTLHGSATEHCSVCKHFISPDSCSKVAGFIAPSGWSKFFSKKTGL